MDKVQTLVKILRLGTRLSRQTYCIKKSDDRNDYVPIIVGFKLLESLRMSERCEDVDVKVSTPDPDWI